MILTLYTVLLRPPPGVLCSASGPPAQEGNGHGGANPEEGHKVNQKAGAPLL